MYCFISFSSTVKLLLSDQLRDHQKVVTEEKWSLNATKVHLTKQSESIYIYKKHFTFNKILCCWYSFESSHQDDSNEYHQHMIFLTLEYLFQAINVFIFIFIRICNYWSLNKSGRLLHVVTQAIFTVIFSWDMKKQDRLVECHRNLNYLTTCVMSL